MIVHFLLRRSVLRKASLTAGAQRDAHGIGDLVDAVLQPRAGVVVEDNRLRLCCLCHLHRQHVAAVGMAVSSLDLSLQLAKLTRKYGSMTSFLNTRLQRLTGLAVRVSCVRQPLNILEQARACTATDVAVTTRCAATHQARASCWSSCLLYMPRHRALRCGGRPTPQHLDTTQP